MTPSVLRLRWRRRGNWRNHFPDRPLLALQASVSDLEMAATMIKAGPHYLAASGYAEVLGGSTRASKDNSTV